MVIDGCEIQAYFCVRCAATMFPDQVDVHLHHFEILSDCAAKHNMNEWIYMIMREAANPAFVNGVLCLSGVEPCPYTSRLIQTKHFLCWKTKMDMRGSQIIFKFSPCETNSYCLESYRACYDPNTGQYVYSERQFNPGGDPSCEVPASEIPYPTVVGQESTPCGLVSWPCHN